MSEALEKFQPQLLMTKSKKDIKAQAEAMGKALVKDANTSALHLHTMARKVTEYMTAVADATHDAAMKEAEKHGKEHTQYDTRFEIKETGVNWKYDNRNDPELLELLEQEKTLKQQIKDRQAFLQKLKKPLVTVDEETGEEITIQPAVRLSTTKLTLNY